ncbi:hypothetical protein AVEN_172332-1 [Araneus ventricosus]|uniref:Uncharacterized protein n=1 Tax=Araneus ventricosus TaxID=182803 RepID=A0A4Y2E598_ARAVE|nr:hypothetical protein AVEN_172332-1 [Araneus ventricosus]
MHDLKCLRYFAINLSGVGRQVTPGCVTSRSSLPPEGSRARKERKSPPTHELCNDLFHCTSEPPVIEDNSPLGANEDCCSSQPVVCMEYFWRDIFC